jgi:hypothetical protein
VKECEIIADNLAKPDGVEAASQRWIPRGEQPGLWTRMATGKRFIVRADEKLTALEEWQRAIHEFAVNLIS